MNDLTNLVVCCPLTTKIKNYHGNVILEPIKLNGLSVKSEVLTFHIRSLSKERLKHKIGEISTLELKGIQNCLLDIWKY
jgi:mRNA interferase MazF